jgi:hypothetical protein
MFVTNVGCVSTDYMALHPRTSDKCCYIEGNPQFVRDSQERCGFQGGQARATERPSVRCVEIGEVIQSRVSCIMRSCSYVQLLPQTYCMEQRPS